MDHGALAVESLRAIERKLDELTTIARAAATRNPPLPQTAASPPREARLCGGLPFSTPGGWAASVTSQTPGYGLRDEDATDPHLADYHPAPDYASW
jgi:hypothetical protein